jgi:hypothetical protein
MRVWVSAERIRYMTLTLSDSNRLQGGRQSLAVCGCQRWFQGLASRKTRVRPPANDLLANRGSVNDSPLRLSVSVSTANRPTFSWSRVARRSTGQRPTFPPMTVMVMVSAFTNRCLKGPPPAQARELTDKDGFAYPFGDHHTLCQECCRSGGVHVYLGHPKRAVAVWR